MFFIGGSLSFPMNLLFSAQCDTSVCEIQRQHDGYPANPYWYRQAGNDRIPSVEDPQRVKDRNEKKECSCNRAKHFLIHDGISY